MFWWLRDIQLMMRTVDGGHRAIKYTRVGGVKPDIYAEGKDKTLLFNFWLLPVHPC